MGVWLVFWIYLVRKCSIKKTIENLMTLKSRKSINGVIVQRQNSASLASHFLVYPIDNELIFIWLNINHGLYMTDYLIYKLTYM